MGFSDNFPNMAIRSSLESSNRRSARFPTVLSYRWSIKVLGIVLNYSNQSINQLIKILSLVEAMPNKKLAGLHGFSLMLGKEHVKRFLILDDSGNQVLFEGLLGELKEISLLEAVMLEIRGSNGILRVDLTEQELRKALK
jgi:hypothetical protein